MMMTKELIEYACNKVIAENPAIVAAVRQGVVDAFRYLGDVVLSELGSAELTREPLYLVLFAQILANDPAKDVAISGFILGLQCGKVLHSRVQWASAEEVAEKQKLAAVSTSSAAKVTTWKETS